MACGTPVAALDRGAVREVVDDGVTGLVFSDLDADDRTACRACSRSIAGACATRPSPDSAPRGWWTSTSPSTGGLWRHTVARAHDEAADFAGRTVLAIFAHPDDESLACGGTLARLADDGVRVVLLCASHGERGHRRTRRWPGAPISAAPASASSSEAAEVLGIAEVILLDHPDGESALGRTSRNCTTQIVQAITTLCARRGHHLRRRRAVLAPRSHRHPRTDGHGGEIVRRGGPVAVLRHDPAWRDAGGHRHRRGQRLGAARVDAVRASRRMPSGLRRSRTA